MDVLRYSAGMLARLQQILVLNLFLGALLWVAFTWRHSPLLSVAGVVLVLLGHAAFLALEFVVVYRLNRHDSAPAPSPGALLRAWAHETWLAPSVFLWQQPFRWNSVPDRLMPAAGSQDQRGIVFIHGFLCNRGFWNPWLSSAMRGGTQPFLAISLEPVFGDIEAYVPQVEAAVLRMTAATGQPPVLICHSMGGLAARAWLRAHAADARVHRIITLGTPHHGTWLARFSAVPSGRQMAPGSDWLRRLAADESPQRRRLFTCYYSNCDNVVFPASVATLEDADNRFVPGVAHVALGFDERIRRESLALARG